MAAYIVYTRERTTNQAELDTYAKLAVPTLKGYPATPRAFYGKLDVLEGPPFEGAVIIEFPTMAEAHEWFDSPAYQAAVKHRMAGSVYRVFIVEGVA
jgi:uncharacterized protein (DUF1330 family)